MIRKHQTSQEIYPDKSWWLVKESAWYQGVMMISEQIGILESVFSKYLGRKIKEQLQSNTGSMFFVQKHGGVYFVTNMPKGTMSALDMEASVTPSNHYFSPLFYRALGRLNSTYLLCWHLPDSTLFTAKPSSIV
jgi:hypothetical protein